MKIGVLIGSTRPGRVGAAIGQWVFESLRDRDTAEYTLVDLLDYDLPLLAEPTVAGSAHKHYEVPQTQVWSATIDALDGFLWVTPEYNRSVPAAMKNAFDVLYPEWMNKAVGFVGYGFDGGVRSVEHWRLITAAAHMVGVRSQVALSTVTDFHDGVFTPLERRTGELARVADQVEQMAGLLAPLRAGA